MNPTSCHGKARASLLLVFVIFCSCSPPQRPAALGRSIASADRLLASDPTAGYRITMEGEPVRRLVAAISTAVGDKSCYGAIFACHVEFYNGSNFLAEIRCQDRVFWSGDEQYSERTGVLRDLQKAWDSDEAGRTNWIDHLAQGVRGNTNFSNLQPWAIELMERFRSGQVRTRPGVTYEYPEFSEQDLPEWVRTAFRGWEVYLVQDKSQKPECVMLNYHCMAGVLVGPSDYKMNLQAWYSTNVAPGIYAYRVSER